MALMMDCSRLSFGKKIKKCFEIFQNSRSLAGMRCNAITAFSVDLLGFLLRLRCHKEKKEFTK